MASSQIIVSTILAVLFTSISAKEFIVGDDNGWTPYFNYQAWAKGKEFVVGDILVFNYPVGAHNVFKVNGTGFQECIKPPLSEALTTGSDVITLATPGRKWYICGVAKHCAVGNQKLVITVLPQSTSPAYESAKKFIVGDDNGWTPYFNYQAWAEGKKFVVGDKLVFNYPVGAHNVFKVNGTGFQECIKPPLSEALTTGNDVITLATPGRKWYICGVAKHCAVGNQKLVITVLPQSTSPMSATRPARKLAAVNVKEGSLKRVAFF
ncbi:blue copper protein-like [Cornus florida]|uniref:blue copper protein-like n=1 Tax=Cornus florida TaxID=4283 RepID=UPI00289D2557|nr:blue copper protein-like [Cornus florida]